MYRPGLNDLDAVVAIARKASFRAAALELGMSTTALSNAVGKLEADLGVRLFNRTTRSVSLTDAGRLFIEQVGPALRDIHGAMEAVRSQQATPSGTLRINAFAMAAREILSPLVSPAYIAKHGKPRVPPDLLHHPCIRVRLPNGTLYRWEFEKGGQTAQIAVSGPMTLDEASLARTAVLEGIGLGFFMEQNVRADIEAGRLIRVLEDWTPPFGGLCLYYPGRRNPSAALKAFIGLARELAAKSGS